MGYSMRTDRYRFTRWVERNDPSRLAAVEFYDHETDPQENRNIADDPANAALVAKLTKQWQAGWQGASRIERQPVILGGIRSPQKAERGALAPRSPRNRKHEAELPAFTTS